MPIPILVALKKFYAVATIDSRSNCGTSADRRAFSVRGYLV